MAYRKSPALLISAIAVLLSLWTAAAPLSAAGKEKLLYTFDGLDGLSPYAGLVFDPAGNMYGTTYSGGAYGYGAVFALSPSAQGTWTETLLHSFNFGNDGVLPCASLVLDASGNLYGTTKAGGAYGDGTIFQLSPGANSSWTETVLHSFNENDGLNPFSGLIFDAAGNLYGTTLYGGSYGDGTVFQLSPGTNGSWTLSVLYSFAGAGSDGANPYAAVVSDHAGALYGTTYAGGAYGFGIVFRLTPGTHGVWTETVLHNFGKPQNHDGVNPYDALVFDRNSNLYGTTYLGGSHNYGAVFRLSRSSGNKWKQTVLRSFNSGKRGFYPYGGLVLDSAGNLYGTTYSGGQYGFGVVFRMSVANRKWSESVLASFDRNDGNGPYATLIADSGGNLFGTTLYGGGSGCGGSGCGAVFKIVP